MKIFLLISLGVLSSLLSVESSGVGIGVNWGTMMSHRLLPMAVVEMLKTNGIEKVKLFDADPWTVTAMEDTGIEVMVAIPNDQLMRLNSYNHAREWVRKNITRFVPAVNIKLVGVGNEPFLESYNGSFTNIAFPALKNIQKALDEAGFGHAIKATIPLNADVYNSPTDNPVPSAGNFRPDIYRLMVKIVKYLHLKQSPFVVNIYPYLSLYQNADFPINYAFFDGNELPLFDNGINYTNMFDANFDTLVSALRNVGVGDLKIIVGEVGWPTDGDKNANIHYARQFYDGLLKKITKQQGTPLRPGNIEIYLFGLFDENMKSISPGNFERHWGIFRYDGKPKFPIDIKGRDAIFGGHPNELVPVKGVDFLPEQWCEFDDTARKDIDLVARSTNYACSLGDCTVLGYGSSCNGLDDLENVSFAFNMYFQMQDQDVRACDFSGLAKITTKNPSRKGCLFPRQIVSAAVGNQTTAAVSVLKIFLFLVFLLMAENKESMIRQIYTS